MNETTTLVLLIRYNTHIRQHRINNEYIYMIKNKLK